MHKLRKAAVLVAALSSVGVLSVGSAHATGMDGDGQGNAYKVQQSTQCKSHDLNIDILGVVGILNGVLGNGLNGEGNPASQSTHLGSEMGCSNSAF
ncbi:MULTISPECIES: hypothetical protein [Streptomyces]|uniref:Secreted protein n=1 Tax=Streptomyces chartreusis TaxID=1969 RepID=A0A7H8T853_STRCX|nr:MULTISPECIES: hypothetical protein [Streptomyces]QKZ18120.1 hypothetical protein HUT05_12600 [Streptomyces chartreusis]SEC07581.1 hypothetical protein SAMN05428938_1176 [Streptomyces sp. KS_5]SED32829.1 hypothetical protein SAMN05216482_6982 [Streptomyces sp. PAN_FS17]